MTHDADALDRNIDHEDALTRTAAHEDNSAARARLLWRVIALVSIATIGVVAALGIREMFGARDGQAAPSVTYARTLAKEVAPKDVGAPAQAAGADKLIEEPAASEKPPVAEEQRTANLEPSAAAPVSDTAQFAEPARNPSPAFAGETTASAAPSQHTKESNFVVQVSAHRTEQEAQEHFQALKARYPKLLSSRSPILARKDLGSKGVFWGAQLGPFASKGGATELCNGLKAAGGRCIIERTRVN